MTVLIGITRSPKETEKHCSMEFKGLGTRAIVGPFGNSEQAADWMEFMKSRAEGYQEISAPTPAAQEASWYGFTFELVDSR